MHFAPISPASLLVTDIGCLAVVPQGPLRGGAMRNIPLERDAAVWIDNGRIAWLGPRRDAPTPARTVALSADGGLAIPGLIDPHTHIPFAGQRAAEFVRRIAGESYLSIMQAGGGIRATMHAVRAATVEQLVYENLPRLMRMLAFGVTTVECKSGYGLSRESERDQLLAMRALARLSPIDVAPTYLGAHALPPEYDGRADAFIDAISDAALLREFAREKLARFCDVFCDVGAFDVAQTRRVFERATAAGLKLKIHADELGQIGATRLAGECGAVSADHLEHTDDAGIDALRAAGTIPVVLPGTSFFLGIGHAPARRLIDAGLPVALGTDFNPGSCMIDSLPLIMNIACCQLRMLPLEVLAACTANAAAAIDEHTRIGSLAPGFDGDLVVLDAASLDDWMYTPGRSRTRYVIKRGRIVYAHGSGREAD
ncbi:MAG: imidazolonepropionase [Phycisphaerae bacterium]